MLCEDKNMKERQILKQIVGSTKLILFMKWDFELVYSLQHHVLGKVVLFEESRHDGSFYSIFSEISLTPRLLPTVTTTGAIRFTNEKKEIPREAIAKSNKLLIIELTMIDTFSFVYLCQSVCTVFFSC